MSVLIKGTKMPSSCYDCNCFILNSEGSDYCCLLMLDIEDKDKRDDDCPLTPVQPHGRLIDADEFFRIFPELISYEFAAPTIIPAEEVYGQYTDTAGNFHWTGTHSGAHTIKA